MLNELLPRFRDVAEFPRKWNQSVLNMLDGFNGPLADVQENDEGFVFTLELPGIDKEKVDVKLSKDVLTITAERTSEKTKSSNWFNLSERRYGKLERSFLLPPVDESSVHASMKDGVLTITMRKQREERGRRVKID